MTHPSKNKGNAFERELVNVAKDSGLVAERAMCSDGRAFGESSEVDLKIDSKRIQAKRRKAIPLYLQVPDGCDGVAFREDRGATLVLITFYEYLDLLKGLNNARDEPGIDQKREKE